MNIKGAFGKFLTGAKKKSPAILTACTLVGLVVTTHQAYKAGLAADDILKKHRERMSKLKPDDKEEKKAIIKETVTKMAPIIAPVIIMGVATGACAIGAQSINGRRIAALSAAYNISEKTIKDLNGKMNEMLGVKKARSVKDGIAKDKLKSSHVQDNQVILAGGDVLCKDDCSGRFFRSNARRLDKAISELSNEVRCCRYVSLNDFYEKIGLAPIPLGRDLGWNEEDTMGDGRLPIEYTAILNDEDEPTLCLEYDIHVRRDYRDLH